MNFDEIYLVMDTWGFCIVCGNYNDLRLGHCFGCADIAKGPKDICEMGGLGKFSEIQDFCLITCKYSMKCRRKQKED